MGWPAENPDDPGRLPLDAVVHNETYRDFGKAEIDKFYNEKEKRDDSKQFVLENDQGNPGPGIYQYPVHEERK